MDLRQYYLSIQQLEESIQGNAVVVVSTDTDDGGRAGILSEVTRHVAARMVVEGRAMLATPEQQASHTMWRQGRPPDTLPCTTDSLASQTTTPKSAVTRPRKR